MGWGGKLKYLHDESCPGGGLPLLRVLDPDLLGLPRGVQACEHPQRLLQEQHDGQALQLPLVLLKHPGEGGGVGG